MPHPGVQSEWLTNAHHERVPGTQEDSHDGAIIATASGKPFHLEDPHSSAFTLYDVVRGMSNVCRFGGQLHRFYSVAEHCVLVHDLLEKHGANEELVLAGLFHDAHEAFYCDIPSPLKRLLGPTYSELTVRFDHVFCNRFGLRFESMHSQAVRAADIMARNIEGCRLAHRGVWEDCPVPLGVAFHAGLLPDAAQRVFDDRLWAHGWRMGNAGD